MNYADSLRESQSLYNAITEYKRLIYFSDDKQLKSKAMFNISQCYKGGGKFDDALLTLSKINDSITSNEFRYKVESEKIRLNILRGTYNRALQLIKNQKREFPEKSSELDYWKGWTYMLSDRWEDAAVVFDSVESSGKLAQLCDSVSHRKYSVPFARYISYILPGAGQFYTGHFIEGIISLGWNVLWGYQTITAFNSERVFDGIMVGNFLWFRFWRGSSQEAEKLAVDENLIISNKAYKFLAEKYKGPKP